MIEVSVIIPFYSSESGRLNQAVESVLNQSAKNIEVIVVDDCSPISAEQELIHLDDPRIKIIRHDKNTNGGIARNTGIDNANGEFIAFLDYDDIWYSDKLEKQLAFWQSVKSDNAVTYCKCKIIEGSRVFDRPERGIKAQERVGDYLFVNKQIIQTSGIFLPASLAKRVKFHDLKRHQDYQFCLSLEAEGVTFHYLDEVLYEFIQIPKLNDYNFSLDWLNSYDNYLSESAVFGFKYLVVLRSMIAHKDIVKAFKFSIVNGFFLGFVKVCLLKLTKKMFFGK